VHLHKLQSGWTTFACLGVQILDRSIKSSGTTALQGLGWQSGRCRSATLVPTFADRGVSRGQRNGSPRPLISVYQTWIATYFIQVAPQLTSRGWVHPVPDPLPLIKSGSAGNQTRDLRICSQKPRPLDHRGSLLDRSVQPVSRCSRLAVLKLFVPMAPNCRLPVASWPKQFEYLAPCLSHQVHLLILRVNDLLYSSHDHKFGLWPLVIA